MFLWCGYIFFSLLPSVSRQVCADVVTSTLGFTRRGYARVQMFIFFIIAEFDDSEWGINHWTFEEHEASSICFVPVKIK